MPAEAFTLIASVPDLGAAIDAVRDGLECEKARFESARIASEVYNLRSLQYLEKREGETDDEFRERPKRASRLCRQVVDKLCEPVYDPGPARAWGSDAAVTKFLETVYDEAQANAVLAEAEAAAQLGDVAAVQLEATGDPRGPLRLWLWKAHEFAVFCRDGDPVRPYAVVTKDAIPAGGRKIRTRYRLYTAAERLTFLTDPFDDTDTSGGQRADTLAEVVPNPYQSDGQGVLPFVFVRAKPAATVSTFWEGGLGQSLTEANLELDRALSDLAQHVKEFLNPRAFARNVSIQGRHFERVGSFVRLASTKAAQQGDSNAQPDVFYLQANLGVEAAWYDAREYAAQTLEELGVPVTLARADSMGDLSGVAIVAKALPLEKRTRKRQRLLTEAECELAAKALAVLGVVHRHARLVAAARKPALAVTWPEPKIPLPTPERDAQDAAELELGLTDPFEVLARRRGLTIDQAEDLAGQIAERRKRWNALMAPVSPEQEQQQQGAPDS
jgi:hypothetical protein